MAKFFSICFLLMPWVMIPNDKLADPFRIPKATFFDLICMGIICFSLFTGLRKRYFNKYLCWFVCWVFFTLFLGFYLPYTLSFNNRQAINIAILEPMLHFIFGLWASYIVLSYFEKGDYIKITKIICISGISISFIGILQVLGLDIFGKIAKYNHPSKICVFLDNPNIVGNYLCLTLPFFLLKENKKYILGLFLAIIGIILTKSELSIISAIIGLLVYLSFINRHKITYFIISVSVMFFMLWGFLNKELIINIMSTRLNIWKMAWMKFKENPIFGQGLGIFKTWELTPMTTKALVAHNDWFEITIMLGVVGLIFLLFIIINSIRKFNYQKDNIVGFSYFASFITFMAIMSGSFPLEIAPLALFGLLNWWAVETF